MKRQVDRLISLLLILVVISGVGVPTFAQQGTPSASPETQDNRSIAFYPEETGEGTFITVELEPGASTEVKVVLGNAGDIEQSLRTYAVPVLSNTNGGFSLAPYGTPNDEITNWVDYPETQYDFAPGEGISIPVKIKVPHDTGPGEYVTGLAAEQSDSFYVPGSEMLRQRVRWSIPVLVVVPGDQKPAFEVGEARLETTGTSVSATIEIVNTGNVIVRPRGEVRLTASDGTVVGVAQMEMGSVYTGSSTTIVVGWATLHPSEMYDIEVVLNTPEGGVEVKKTFTDVVPAVQGSTKASPESGLLSFLHAELSPSTDDSPPSLLMFDGEISNPGDPIENARVSIVTYKDGEEVDRYPIMQAVTIHTGTTPVEARYSLPGGFTTGTYTFEVTIETGDAGTQSVLVTQPIDYEITVP